MGRTSRTLKGWALEWRYGEHAPSYFRPIVRRAHRVSPEELAAIVDDALDTGRISEEEPAT